jgi:phage tail sheath protein FI
VRKEKRVVQLAAPACTDAEYDGWRSTIQRAALFIADHRRDMQLLAGLPMPRRESDAAAGLLGFMHQRGWLSGALSAQVCPALSAGLTDAEKEACSIASAFVQLGYPWLQAGYAGDLPANLEPPEGVMAGLLARNALTRGTFCSATALPIHDLVAVAPPLRASQQFGINPQAPLRASPQAPLIDRVSLFGPSPQGFYMLSDVTTSNDSQHRQANISRTIGLVMRVARSIGEEYAFESAGERIWGQLQARLEDVLAAMQRVGALAGTRPGEAFQVRCDRSTMTQQDIDNGRVIAQVMIRPVASIETMRIQLAFGGGGHVSLSPLGLEAA